jgi:N-acetylneuraminic acid mutarotase
MQFARQRFDGAIDSSGYVYALGGDGIWGVTPVYSSVERWNPATDVWSDVAPMSRGRDFFGSVFGGDGLLYAIGGGAGNSSACERYNPVTNSWSPIHDLPQPRTGVSAAIDGLGRVYAIGGGPALGSPTNTVFRYDSVTNSWPTVASMNTARHTFGCATDPQGRIYAIGGAYTNTVERYDPSTNTWSYLAPLPGLPGTRDGSAAAYGGDNAIYSFGGWDGSAILKDILRYDIGANTWSNWGQMSVAKDNLAAESAPDGNVYFFGGEGPAIHQSQAQMQKLVVPEPATLSLVALGGLAMLYRRRR